MRALPLLFMLSFAACAKPTPVSPVASPSATPSQSATARPAPATLSGEWRVAGIDGRELNEPYVLALSANERAIWWEPRCAGMVRGYRIDGGAIAFGPNPDLPPQRVGGPTRPVCTIGLPPRLAEVFRALDSATTIERTAANGVLIAGGGHSVLLFSQ
jgi:hypothetical protein